MTKKNRIAIFDDHPILLAGLKCLIDKIGEYELVGGAEKQDGFKSLVEQSKPDLVIVDIIQDDHIGLDLFEFLIQHYPDLKIVAYSSVKSPVILQFLKNLGIHGFIGKHGHPSTLLEAVKRVLAGERHFKFDFEEVILPASKKPSLTPRELEVLQAIGNGMTSKEIAGQYYLSPNTVNNHRKNMMRKFNCKNSGELLIMAKQLGILY